MKRNIRSQIILNIILSVISVAILIPFLLLISISISNEHDIITEGYKLIPKRLDMSAYKFIFQNPDMLLSGYKITVFTSIVGTLLAVIMMSMIAYPLSQRAFKARNTIAFYLYFAGLFGGGMVPTYLLYTQFLHLQDTIWVYLIPGWVNAFHVFMIRTYMQGVNGEIVEAAIIDGANDFMIFIEFMIPLAKPVLATVALFNFLGRWVEWQASMLYINNEKLYTVQYLLQKILKNIEIINNNQFAASVASTQNIPSETVRMAMAVSVALPAILIFPFFQRYFVKGMTVGSVKG